MKKIILLAFILAFAANLSGQHNHEQRAERIKAMKVAYITDKLDLSPGEAEAFWPVYNEFQEKERAIQKGLAHRFSDGPPDISAMSDEEMEELILGRFREEKELVDLRIEYYGKMKEILPVPKIFRLYEAEMQFRKVLLEKLRDERPERDKRP